MTADEAKELMSGTLKHKGLIFKARLAWTSGIINKQIENAAESGKSEIRIFKSKEFSEKYYLLIAQFYNDLGFSVLYNSGRYFKGDNEMLISWGLDDYSFDNLVYLINNHNFRYLPDNIAKRYEAERINRLKR